MSADGIKRINTILYCRNWDDTVKFYRELGEVDLMLRINGPDYFDKYDRWAYVGFAGRALKIKDADL